MQHPGAAGSATLNRDADALSSPEWGLHKWRHALRTSDIHWLWAELHRIVCSHPLVRASYSAGLFEEGAPHAQADLAQELFVQLLAKQRFQHYLDAAMTDAEIEQEISQIELSNLLTLELCKRYPESYRFARRISRLIKASDSFRRFDAPSEGGHQRLVNQVYGLRKWPANKARRPLHEVEHRVQQLSVRRRDIRLVGRSGDAQVIISNVELKALIIEVLEALDTPVDMRNLRKLVMSRLPLLDIYLVPLDGGDEHGNSGRPFEPVDGRANPEQVLLRRETEARAVACVDQFLQGLHATVRGDPKRYELMLKILWRCYLSQEQPITQLAFAAQMNVSDTLIFNYRRRIERQLGALAFSEIEPARQFETALRERVQLLLQPAEVARRAVGV